LRKVTERRSGEFQGNTRSSSTPDSCSRSQNGCDTCSCVC